jgi:hypothetical protein
MNNSKIVRAASVFFLTAALLWPSSAQAARIIRTEEDLSAKVQHRLKVKHHKRKLQAQDSKRMTLEERIQRIEHYLRLDKPIQKVSVTKNKKIKKNKRSK